MLPAYIKKIILKYKNYWHPRLFIDKLIISKVVSKNFKELFSSEIIKTLIKNNLKS